MHVQSGKQMPVFVQSQLVTLVSQRQNKWQGYVVEGIGRGMGDGAGHIGDAIMNGLIDHVGGV